MSAKHGDPEFRKNSRIIRQQVAKARRLGRDVGCWRCGYLIDAEQTYDVGHLDPTGGHSIDNLAPEHRYKTGRCQGNRAHGGRIGQARSTARRSVTAGLLPW